MAPSKNNTKLLLSVLVIAAVILFIIYVWSTIVNYKEMTGSATAPVSKPSESSQESDYKIPIGDDSSKNLFLYAKEVEKKRTEYHTKKEAQIKKKEEERKIVEKITEDCRTDLKNDSSNKVIAVAPTGEKKVEESTRALLKNKLKSGQFIVQ